MAGYPPERSNCPSDPSIYPSDYYTQGLKEYSGQDNRSDVWNARQGTPSGGAFAGLGYGHQLSSLASQAQCQNQLKADPGVTSAIEVLSDRVSDLSVNASDLESVLGLAGPETGSADKIAHSPSLIERLRDLALRIEVANYRVQKSLNHLRS